jgi:hypothetical protein
LEPFGQRLDAKTARKTARTKNSEEDKKELMEMMESPSKMLTMTTIMDREHRTNMIGKMVFVVLEKQLIKNSDCI